MHAWATVLLADDVYSAAARIFIPRREGTRPPPNFLYLLVLDRAVLTAQTLQLLLKHAWEQLRGETTSATVAEQPRDSTKNEQDNLQDHFEHERADISTGPEIATLAPNASVVDGASIVHIVTRLLRHARAVWPEGIVDIARIIPAHVHANIADPKQPTMSNLRRLSRLSSVYNRILCLLAEPASAHPFKSTIYQEEAQFDLLRSMAAHRPPLKIAEKGYKAVVSVLLARPKTERERDWASLQAKSWPPWKVNRTGLDEAKDAEYGSSRAVVAMRRMMEAGYGAGDWGTIAKVFAGWDPDGSPTVQTRTLLSPGHPGDVSTEVWKARIKTTRTVREAWACFLSYRASGCRLSPLVYSAMISKLQLGQNVSAPALEPGQRSHESREENDVADIVLPGDTPMPFPEPVNPSDVTYVPSEPPSASELFQEMLDKDVHVSNELVAQLVRNSSTIEEGIGFLDTAGDQYRKWMHILASGDNLDRGMVRKIPRVIVAAFVTLLCRAARDPLHLVSVRAREAGSSSAGTPDWRLRRESPPLHAIHLLSLRKDAYTGLWATVLTALGDFGLRLGVGEAARTRSGEEDAMHKLRAARRVLETMRSRNLAFDTTCLRAMSKVVENAALSEYRMRLERRRVPHSPVWGTEIALLANMHSRDTGPQPADMQVARDTTPVTTRASHFLRRLFHEIVSGSASSPGAPPHATSAASPPPLLAVPSPAQLHAYARALGVLGDHEGLWSLAQWLATHRAALWALVGEEGGGGRRRWAALLAALRVFLDCPGRDARVRAAGKGAVGRLEPAGGELRALVCDRLAGVEEWRDLWPGREDVAWYLEKGGAEPDSDL
ncbi:MAG: hypothetical protein INR71_02750 [Terriglobus roseus]|nr:hypothetical protein [Terriglobus roseus]